MQHCKCHKELFVFLFCWGGGWVYIRTCILNKIFVSNYQFQKTDLKLPIEPGDSSTSLPIGGENMSKTLERFLFLEGFISPFRRGGIKHLRRLFLNNK